MEDKPNFNHLIIVNLPIVGIWLVGKWSSENLSKMQLLPTDESPIMINLIRWSYYFFAAPEFIFI